MADIYAMQSKIAFFQESYPQLCSLGAGESHHSGKLLFSGQTHVLETPAPSRERFRVGSDPYFSTCRAWFLLV